MRPRLESGVFLWMVLGPRLPVRPLFFGVRACDVTGPGCDRSYRNRRSQLSVMCSLQNPTVHAVHTQPMQILPGSLCQTPRREPTASLSGNSVDLELSVAQSLGTRLHRSAGCQLRTARRWVLGGRPVGLGVATEEETLAGGGSSFVTCRASWQVKRRQQNNRGCCLTSERRKQLDGRPD